MRRSRLFWRLFWAFLAALLVTSTLLSAIVVVMVRDERTTALENEVRLQARDVAKLMQQYDAASVWGVWGRDSALVTTLNWKIREIQENYSADVWLIYKSLGSLLVRVLGESEYAQEQLNDPAVRAQLEKVISGEEIRVQGLIPRLGSNVVAVGVPWTTEDGGVVSGAVLLLIATDSLSADYRDILGFAAIATTLSMTLGAVLAFVIARRQIKPLQQIKEAVADFARGRFERRVEIRGDAELVELGECINKMAADLSNLEASRRSFVGSVSHELRSPLTSMRGYIEGMLDGTIPPEDAPKYMDVVLAETRRLSKLVTELLDLSRYDSGKMTLHMTRFDLCELLRVELIKFEGRIDEKRLDVTVSLPDTPVFVMADLERIRQVAINLLDNAIKFADEGGALSLFATVDGAVCTVAVANSGEPIAPDDLPHIFERFYKADKAHTAGKGTGLGLAIVKTIIEQHGERIAVESAGQSTRFTFTLRRAEPGDLITTDQMNGGNIHETDA